MGSPSVGHHLVDGLLPLEVAVVHLHKLVLMLAMDLKLGAWKLAKLADLVQALVEHQGSVATQHHNHSLFLQ